MVMVPEACREESREVDFLLFLSSPVVAKNYTKKDEARLMACRAHPQQQVYSTSQITSQNNIQDAEWEL